MKYSLGIWQVDSQENKIKNTQTSEVTRMSPRAMEVLHYFLQNPQKVISLDELIEKIWLGRIVGDHAVYRVINKIRKHLDSDNKDAYIETIPRMGYKLKQSVQVIELSSAKPQAAKSNNTEQQDPISQQKSKKLASLLKPIFVLLIITSIALVLFYSWQKFVTAKTHHNSVQTYNSFLPFVSLQGFHHYVNSSENGSYIVFSHKPSNKSKYNLFIMDVKKNELKNITRSDIDDINAAISNDAQTIVFVRRDLNGCSVVRLKKYAGTYLEENLFNCIGNENLDIVLTNDGSKLFYTYKNSESDKSLIYSMVVNTGEKKQLLSNSIKTLAGKAELVLSANNKVIYLLTNNNSHRSKIHSYDLQSGKEELILQKEIYIENLNFRANNNSLTFNTNNTSIHEYSLDYSTEKEILSSLSERVYSYDFIGQTDDLLIVSGNEQNSIWQKNLNRSLGHEQITVSEFQDIFPSYANSSLAIVFVSNRTGQQQLWLKPDVKDSSEAFQLTNFSEKQLTDWFKWSPDDSKILTYNRESIYWVDSKSGEISDLVFTKEYPDAKYPTWSHDGKSIYFSSSKTGEIQLYEHQLDSKENSQYSDSGLIALFDQGVNGKYFFKAYRHGLWKDSQGIDKLIIGNIGANKFIHSVNFTPEGIYFLRDLTYQLYFYRFLDLEDSLAQYGRVVIEPKKIDTVLPNKYFSIDASNKKILFYQTHRDKTRLLKNR